MSPVTPVFFPTCKELHFLVTSKSIVSGKHISPARFPPEIAWHSFSLERDGRSAMFDSEATLSYHEAEGNSASTEDTARQMLYMDSEGLDPLIKQKRAASLSTKYSAEELESSLR